MKQYIILLFFICYVQRLLIPIAGECNVCNRSTNFACISDTEYKQCTNGTPSGRINQCNDGSYCSILGSCSEVEELADCKECNKCDSTNTFACTGTKTFALCLGEESLSDMGAQCTGDLVCNIYDAKICIQGSSTCSYRDDPTEAPTTVAPTVPSPATNATAFCAAMNAEGRYPVGTDTETTCHQYVHCLYINAQWYGPIYNCPGNTYYDSSKRSCVSTPPSTCGIVVERLSFRSILLE